MVWKSKGEDSGDTIMGTIATRIVLGLLWLGYTVIVSHGVWCIAALESSFLRQYYASIFFYALSVITLSLILFSYRLLCRSIGNAAIQNLKTYLSNR